MIVDVIFRWDGKSGSLLMEACEQSFRMCARSILGSVVVLVVDRGSGGTR